MKFCVVCYIYATKQIWLPEFEYFVGGPIHETLCLLADKLYSVLFGSVHLCCRLLRELPKLYSPTWKPHFICPYYRRCWTFTEKWKYCNTYSNNWLLNSLCCNCTCVLGFHTIWRDTPDNRHSGHVGVPNKRNNQNCFVKSTPSWPPWRQGNF